MEKVTVFFQNRITKMSVAAIAVTGWSVLLIKITDWVAHRAAILSETALAVTVFLFNMLSFIIVAISVINLFGILYSYLPYDEGIFEEWEETQDITYSDSLILPLKDRIFLLAVTAVIAVVVTGCFYYHIGYVRRLYDVPDTHSFAMNIITV